MSTTNRLAWAPSSSRRKLLFALVTMVLVCTMFPSVVHGQRAAASLGTKVKKKFRRSNRDGRTASTDDNGYYVQGEDNSTIAKATAIITTIFVRPFEGLINSSSDENDEKQQDSDATETARIVVAVLFTFVAILLSFWKYNLSNRKEDGE